MHCSRNMEWMEAFSRMMEQRKSPYKALSSRNITRPIYVHLNFLDANTKTEKGRKVKIISMDDMFHLRSHTLIISKFGTTIPVLSPFI